MKIFKPNLVQRRNTTVRQIRNRKLVRLTSSVESLEQMWAIKFGARLKKQTAIMAERAEFIYRENPRWRRPPY